jgi:hypothetical protein
VGNDNGADQHERQEEREIMNVIANRLLLFHQIERWGEPFERDRD